MLYPPTCVLCGAPGDHGRDLCAGCADDLPLIGVCCALCAQPFAFSAVEPPTDRPSICGNCQRQPPPFDRSIAAFRYEDPLPGLVAGINAARLVLGQEPLAMPEQSVIGALARHITTADAASFQPMNSNFGLLPEPQSEKRLRKRERRERQGELAIEAIERLVEGELSVKS